ncbi:protein SLG1-like [Lytechinus variegatus]|uniref:protein SLG1-like n=1 Tax=Lytechinus variegatus TaxID=7654 RepID=UPI001BB117FA|nr:protein SLG1-like [Lytechinus variegatus]
MLNDQFCRVFTRENHLPLDQLGMLDVNGGVEDLPKLPDLNIGIAGIAKLLEATKVKKAHGPDDISNIVLKEDKDQIAPVLTMILQKSLDEDYTYLGCFYENNRREALPDLIYCNRDTKPSDSCQNTCGPQAQYCQSQEMTIELCRDICADQNMRYFGLQAGAQCLCGGFFAPYNVLGQPDGNDTCNRPCSGNSSQLCGTDFQASVYQINESPSDCFNPGYVLNGDQSQQDSSFYNASDVIDFAPVCPPPSIKNGATSITCTASGNWTNPPPTCTVRCATPTAPMYASFSSWQTLNDSYAVDDEVFFDCDMDPSRTNQTLTCGYYGDWETFVPDCPETPPPTSAATPISAFTTASTVSTPTQTISAPTTATTISTPEILATGATTTSQGVNFFSGREEEGASAVLFFEGVVSGVLSL